MKFFTLFIITFLSTSVLADNIAVDNLNKESFNSVTQDLCTGINLIELENYKKMACLKILKKGVDMNNFYSMYTLYNALNSSINFKEEYDLKFLLNKMKLLENLNLKDKKLLNSL
jgi:hypothetical protein